MAAKFGSSLGIMPSQLGVLLHHECQSLHCIAALKASSTAHAGFRGISNSTLDFDKVRLEEQQVHWHGAADLVLSCC